MSKTILVVEDDKDLLNLVTLKLEQEGFKVDAAETGQQVLDYLENNLPDLVLLDILLPDIDGITVLNEIATHDRTKNLPVIILSNLADQGSFEQAAAVGNYEYLVKAKVDLSELAAKIKSKLNC
ncbi:MAG: response regulator [Patescibacteria group bacterium]|jgi:DNA-binding response OmpR family regulator|nr:response regulator [Patescibacteria group bacterium]